MSHEEVTSELEHNAAYFDSYLDAASLRGHEGGKNLSLRLPNPILDIVCGLAAIDTDSRGEQVTLGSEVRAAILFYADVRRQEDGFVEQIERAKERLQRYLPPEPDTDSETAINRSTDEEQDTTQFEATQSLRRVVEKHKDQITSATQHRPHF